MDNATTSVKLCLIELSRNIRILAGDRVSVVNTPTYFVCDMQDVQMSADFWMPLAIFNGTNTLYTSGDILQIIVINNQYHWSTVVMDF
jgi:hypothetical protein